MRSIASGPRRRMKKIGRAWLSIVILALAIGCPFAYAQPAIAAEQPANIVFVDGAAVTLAPDSAGAFELETPVKNTGGAPGEPSFKLLGLDNAKCNKDNKDLIPDPAIGSLDPNAVAIAHFTITAVPLPAVWHIELQSTAHGGNTTLKPVKMSQQYATATIADYLFWCRVAAGMTV